MRRRQALLCTLCSAALVPGSALASAPALTRATLPAIGISLSVPKGWVESAPSAGLASQHVVDVYHARAPNGGYLANLTVIVATVPPRVSLREWLLGSEEAKFLSLGTLNQFSSGGQAGLAYTSSKLESFRGSSILTSEYGFRRGARGYLFTYTSLVTPESTARETLFRDSAATIRFMAAAPVAS